MALNRTQAVKILTSNQCEETQKYQQCVTIQSPARTPIRHSPTKNVIGISQVQKQALIDNLQLEITERARKLRAQYALQAQGLRNRIELRINRIPKSLRTANMGELFDKYQVIHNEESKKSAAPKPAPPPSETIKPVSELPSAQTLGQSPKDTKRTGLGRMRGLKRKSDDIDNVDKENAPDPMHLLPNPKKRTRTAPGAATHQAPNPSTVLSPKSSNSRTLPHSPIHTAASLHPKSNLSRPASPLKPMVIIRPLSPAKGAPAVATATLVNVVNEKSKPAPARAKGTTTRKASNSTAKSKPPAARPKRVIEKAPPASRSVSNSSNNSNTSSSTTIMKRGAKTATTATVPLNKKRNLKVGVQAVGKKAAAVVEAPAAGRRVLRKRA